MALLTNAQIREVLIQIKPKFDKGLQEVTPPWPLDELASQDTCSQGEVILHWVDMLPIVRDWTGVSKELVNWNERGYRIRIRDLERTSKIRYKELERANKRMLKLELSNLTQAVARYKHDLVTQAILFNGLSVDPRHPFPDAYAGYDNVGLFGVHPINPDFPLTATIEFPVSGGSALNSQSNVYTGLPLNAANWAVARGRGRQLRDPRGINLGVEYDTLVVPPTQVEAAYEAVGAKIVAVFPTTQSGASKENVNATITLLANGVMIVCMRELDNGSPGSETTWYPMCRRHSSGVKPFEVMIEKEMFFGTSLGSVAGLNEYNSIATEDVLFAASGRAVAYATLWFLSAKCMV